MKNSIVGTGQWLARVAGSLWAVLVVSIVVVAVSVLVGTFVLDEWYDEWGPPNFGWILLGALFAQLLYFGTPANIGVFVPMLLLLVPLYNAALQRHARNRIALLVLREGIPLVVYAYMAFESAIVFIAFVLGGSGWGFTNTLLGFLIHSVGIVGMGVFSALFFRRIARWTAGRDSLVGLCLSGLAYLFLVASALLHGLFYFGVIFIGVVDGHFRECPEFSNSLLCFALIPWLLLLVLAGWSMHWWVYTRWLKPNGVERSLP